LAFILVLICFLMDGLLSTWLLFSSKATQDQQRQVALDSERLLQYNEAYKNELALYNDIILTSKLTYVRDTFSQVILTNLQMHDQPDSDQANRDFEASLTKFYNVALNDFSDLSTLIRQGLFDAASTDLASYTSDFKAVTNLLATRRQQLDTERSTGDAAVSTTIFLSAVVLILLTLFSIFLVLLLLFLVERVLVRPLNILQSGLDSLAEGNLDQQIIIHNRDEVGKLSTSFQVAVSSLQKVFNGVQISQQLQLLTGQLASVSHQQETGSKQQVLALDEVLVVTEQLEQTAGLIAERAVQVADITSTTISQIELVAAAGQTSRVRTQHMVTGVANTLSGVERIGEQVSEFSAMMSGLNRQTERISTIIALQSSIAEEVHLLALNAAIEAAGAGQAGARFEVIASEVRQLATRVNQTNQEVRALIESVQVSSRSALSQVQKGQSEILLVTQANSDLRHGLQELEQSAAQVSEAVSQLVSLAEQVGNQAAEIKQATQQQHLSSAKVILSARSAGGVAAQTAETTHLILNSSVTLEALTDQLNEVLSQVKLAG
jgi:methyl-accepting chemotaxis protein